jgi:hypothetical protein
MSGIIANTEISKIMLFFSKPPSNQYGGLPMGKNRKEFNLKEFPELLDANTS